MLLGKIFGKVTTKEFKFIVESETKKFEYVQVYHGAYEYVLCQVIEIEKHNEMTTASCQVIGFKDKEGKIKKLKIPFEPGSEVFIAEDKFIADIIQLENPVDGAYLGKLDGKDINIYLDLKKLLTKHVAILAKSGSGKSYTVGVLLEEIIDKKVPLLIIDPHGEYSSMSKPNTQEDEVKAMVEFNIQPEGFTVNEYGDTKINPNVRPLRLPNELSPQELIDMLPTKLTSSQLGLLYSATQNLGSNCDFDSVLYNLQEEESSSKWNIISVIEQLRNKELFSSAHTPYHELVKPSSCSILNFRGIDPDMQDIIVYKITKDLFELRKQNKIPPFFLVVEEAHNYCPERNFGERKASKILRTIASEGRKFGLGLCIVSQRPARVDKSVISQCSTQIIMKVTNPNDLKMITSSVEGITSSTEKEIQDISVGTALVTGITDIPLFVRVRPRKSLHGGHAVDILGTANKQQTTLLNQINNQQKTKQQEQHTIIKTNKDIKLTQEQQANQQTGQSFTNNLTKTINDASLPQQTTTSEEVDLVTAAAQFEEAEILPLIKPTITPQDIILMSERKILRIETILQPIFIMTCEDEQKNPFKLLIDAITGEVIVDKETGEVKELPALDNLTKNEIRILQMGFQLKKFTTIDLSQKGMQLDLSAELQNLIRKTYLKLVDKDTYTLNEHFIFNRLENYKIFDEINYEKVTYQLKKDAAFTIDMIMQVLEKFVNITDHAQGYLILYKPIYEDE